MPKCRVVPISMLEILDDEKNMNDNMENALVFTGNIILFCMIWYVVFILGYSGGWFAFYLFFTF